MNYSYGINWLIIIVSIIITLGSQFYIKAKYKTTKKIKINKSATGKEIARKILDSNNLHDVEIQKVPGTLNDHYDPRNKVVRLSNDIYSGNSIASASVAAHECGHAIQDKQGYMFLRIRSSIFPIVNISSTAGYVAIIIGIFTGAIGFIKIGIIFELVILLFQLITLPVEFDASRRGIKELKKHSILNKKELSKSKGMLNAAALTYVAAVAASILEIVRLLMIANRKR